MLSQPGVPALLAGAALGRLAYALQPVTVFLALSRHASISTAAVLTAVQGLVGALLFPGKGRLVDRYGGSALRAFAGTCALASLAAGLLGSTPWTFGALLLVTVTSPPVTSTVRAGLGRAPLREATFALDAVLEEAAFLTGPALAGLAVAFVGAGPALWFGGLLFVGAVALLVKSTDARPVSSPRRRGLRRGTWLIGAALAVSALGQGLIGATIAFRAHALHSSALYGVLLSLDGVGALLGALAVGSRGSLPRRLVVLGFAGPLVAVPLALVSGTVAVMAAVFLLGLPVAAMVATLNAAVTTVEDENRWTEAFSWLVTGQNLAGSAGFALGGLLTRLAAAVPAAAGIAVIAVGFGALLPGCTLAYRQAKEHDR